jgi:tetraacyldisaccharide-1-P 4'-kinase
VRESDLRALRARIESYAPSARLCEARHAPVRLRNLADGEALPVAAVRGRRVLALSSIGNPAAFERTLDQIGAVVVDHARFPDHYAYGAAEVGKLLAAGAGAAEMIVTTEKDAVRLPPDCVDKRMWVLEIELAGRAGAPPLSEELDWLLAAEGQN